MIKTSGEIVELLEAGNAATFSVVLRAGDFFDDGDAKTVCEFLRGVNEGDVFVLHHEADRSARFATAEALKSLPSGIDGEGGSVLIVKRAVCFKKGASSFKGEVGANDIDDISGLADHLDCFFWYAAHG